MSSGGGGWAGRGGRWAGRLGLLLALLLWVGSIGALVEAMRANQTAGLLARAHGNRLVLGRVEHMQGLAVMWCVVMAALQIASLLAGTGVLRVRYRLRTALCFAVSGLTLVALNAMWLLGLLVWLRMFGDTG